MAIPLASTPQAGGTFFAADTINTPNDPAGNGVDSHHIEFQLETASNVMKVETVVGASGVESQKVDDALGSLKLRLLEVYEKGSCLVSFGSSESFDRITNTQTGPTKANSSSLVEQILAQQKNNSDNEIKLPNNVVLKPITRNTQTVDGWKFHTGEFAFHVAGSLDRTIEFREFCPDYEGKSLDSATLLAALKHVPEPKPEDSHSPNAATNTPCPQFYSANGIGRSASLAVLYSFKEMCTQQNGVKPALVEQHLGNLIKQGRQQRHTHFVNSREQVKQLLAACNQINNEIIEAATKSKSADQASTDNSGPAATAAAAAASAVPQNPATPQDTREIDPVIKELAKETNRPKFSRVDSNGSRSIIEDPFPYMPINLNGITAIASKEEFKFPELSIKQAEDISTDIIKAGFYGDALGADLEARFFVRPNHVTSDRKTPREVVLVQRMDSDTQKMYLDSSTTPKVKDDLLIAQLKQTYSIRGHEATDDTQQGALSALVKMAWIKDGNKDLNKLAEGTLAAFGNSEFPNVNRQPNEPPTKGFTIRGGAGTLGLCKSATAGGSSWKDATISERTPEGQFVRAGGAGNGGLMRIGYDLLPLLASGATTQDLIEQVLISNQVTHTSSFSAAACVAQVILMAKCINLRLKAENSEDKKLTVPDNFFIDTYHEVMRELEHTGQLFNLDRRYSAVPRGYTHKEWRAPRLPSEFLKAAANTDKTIKACSVEQALIDTAKMDNSSKNIDSVLQKWSSDAYLAATFPSVVFLLEKFGKNPALAVNMAALVTRDSDTCATIIAQVMGALHGSKWVDEELETCKDSSGKSTFHRNLGDGPTDFTVDDFSAHMKSFYAWQAAKTTI